MLASVLSMFPGVYSAIPHRQGRVQLAAYLDVVERFFHGPAANFSQLPAIGVPERGKPLVTPAAYVEPLKRVKADGSPAYNVEITRIVDTADPCTLFRNYLEAQHDGNAGFVLAGLATNLVAALDFRGLKPMIADKIKIPGVCHGPGRCQHSRGCPGGRAPVRRMAHAHRRRP
ncbi:MAG TPA: hypothetical protein VG273_01170 [Bryobacteraceae bacterium]|nr:hypothetical protein [Bryobacteraceae bacterium]